MSELLPTLCKAKKSDGKIALELSIETDFILIRSSHKNMQTTLSH
jgi:hypothetical protein